MGVFSWIRHWIWVMQNDSVKGPKIFLISILGMFLWIFFLQVAGADLWYDHGYAQIPTIEEIK